MPPSAKELAVVTAVGAGLSFLAGYVPYLNRVPLLSGAALYLAGYYVYSQRPDGGWDLLEG